MKRIVSLALFLVLGLSLALPMPVEAQATSQTWSSSITYYTPSATGGEMMVMYYDGATTYSTPSFPLEAHKAGSVAVGSVSGMPTGFKGSAVISASVPVIATSVMFSTANTAQYSRSFYSGFDASKASSTFYLATVRSNGITTSSFGIQNIESFAITATLNFYRVGEVAPAFTHTVNIPASAAYVAKISDVPGYPGNPFDGSLVISATKQGDATTPGKVVATAYETQDSGRGVFAYEGTGSGSNKVYSASASCMRGPSQATTYFAIQNADTTDASVSIEYFNTAGLSVGTAGPFTISAGGKLQSNPCQQNFLVGELGSAVFSSTGGKIIVIGKYQGTDGLITAFTGESEGATKLGAPYIRWAPNPNTNWSSFIAVMNVGTAPATNVIARYYDATGTLRAEIPLATVAAPLNQFVKVNTNPSTAGALVDGGFGYSPSTGGALEIVSDQPLVAVVRLTTNPLGIPGTTTLGEDYNMVPIP